MPPLWNPATFELAVKHVALARNLAHRFSAALTLANLIRQVIEIEAYHGREASLPCPAPMDDPGGRYRVVTFGVPIIERLDESGEWVSIEAGRVTMVPAGELER